MSIDNLKDALPEYGKDLKLNLGSVARTTLLTEQQLWGVLLATSAATRSEQTLSEISDEASQHLSDEAYNAALGAASIMAMNNVFYRCRGYLSDEYSQLRPNLRMNIIGNPGVDKADFELWALAVSAINGCQHCVESHEAVLRKADVGKESIFEAVRIASIISGVAQTVEIEAAK